MTIPNSELDLAIAHKVVPELCKKTYDPDDEGGDTFFAIENYITLEEAEAIAARMVKLYRLVEDIKEHSIPVARGILEEDSRASMSYQRYNRLKQALEGK